MSEWKDENGHPFWGQEPIPPNSTLMRESGKTRKVDNGMNDITSMKCGCGRMGRYLTSDGKMACNKHVRCPTYDELEAANKDLLTNLFKTLRCAKDLSMYRDSTSSYKDAEQELQRLLAKYTGE